MKRLLLFFIVCCACVAAAQPSGPAGSGLRSSNLLNPNISVIGDFAGFSGHSPDTEEPAFAFREAELGFQSQVDPWTWADFFIAVAGEGGVDLEEGYLQFPALLPGLGAKAGKFRMDLGKFNRTHPPETPFADRPLPARRFFGDEGLAGTGLALSYLVPNPLDLYVNLDLEAVNTPEAAEIPAFDVAARKDLLTLGRLSGYADLTESLNLNVGASYALGANGFEFDPATGSSTTLRSRVAAADVTVRWKEPRRAIYRSLLWQTEGYRLRQEQAGGAEPVRAGWFSFVDWQFLRRWHAGARYGQSQAPAQAGFDKEALVFLTFAPSEYSLLSLQGRRGRFADGGKESVGWLKWTYNIGPHGAHPF